MPADRRRLRVLVESVPAHLSDSDSVRPPASPDLPWVTALVEAIDTESGERLPVDLSRVTSSWLADHLGQRTYDVLSLLERIRSAVPESMFAYLLAGIAVELIYEVGE
jgi:hypothetical protein